MTGEDKVLIFCATKKRSEELSRILNAEGFRTIAIHGDKTQKDRDRAIEQFRGDKVRILVATDVVARGLDIKDISFVINYDFPKNMDDYVHRIGRTGRAGAKGIAVSFINPEDDQKIVNELVDFMTEAQQSVPQALADLQTRRGGYGKPSYNKPSYGGYNRGGQ